jgi:hypothetical protein
MRALATVLLLMLAPSALADEPKSLDEAMKVLAKDLATLQGVVQSQSQKQWVYNPSRLRITRPNAPLYKGADSKSQVVTKLPEGTSAAIVDRVGPWYAIKLNDQYQQTGWVEAGTVVPEPAAFGPYPVTGDDLYERAMEQVKILKKKYEENPYIRITGFSLEVSVPPAISVDFEFK